MKEELDKKNFGFNFHRVFSSGLKINFQQAAPFWVASLLTGLVAVGYAKLFGYAEDLLHLIFEWHRWLIFILAPLCFFLAWLIVQKFSPKARGSGIPQVMAAIELSTPKFDKLVDRFLSIRIVIVKILSSLLMLLGGGAIGREGPTIQIAGSIFRVVNRLIPGTWTKLSNQSFILTGAAAGLAAAFNTPLGGIVFAVEELARIHMRFFRTALFSAVIIAGLTAQGLLGSYLYLGYPNVRNLPFTVFFGVAATAVLAGLLGGLMARFILIINKWKKSFSLSKTILFIFCSGILIAAIAYFVNEQILGSGKDLMNNTLFTSDKQVAWHTVIMRILGPAICFNTGGAGGIFAPSLAAGAAVGAFLSSFFVLSDASANIIILSGMVGFLTGVTRTPFTSAILVLEMTDRHSVIFHLMLAGMVSNIAAFLIDKKSLYEHLKELYIKEIIPDKKE